MVQGDARYTLDAPPLPAIETRLAFIAGYAEDSLQRLEALLAKGGTWWEQEIVFVDTRRSRAWIWARRIAHTAHRRCA